MIKFLISIYIAAILLIAGFAEANQSPVAEANQFHISAGLQPSSFHRIRHAAKVILPVGDARFDSRKELLSLSGNVSSSCINSVKPELMLDQRTNAVLVSVTALGKNCFDDSRNYYEIVIDIKTFFAENSLNKDAMVSFHIDNYVGGDDFNFKYFAKQQIKYSFDTVATGKIELDLRTGKFYLMGRGSKIEIFSRINLHNYVDRFVQIKGLVPNTFAIGEGAGPADARLIVGQLTALR